MTSFSSCFNRLLLVVALGVGASGCFVPDLSPDVIFSCDVAEDCIDKAQVCAPRQGQRGYCCLPRPEVCNYVDDDCDGEVDEGFDVGASCAGT